MTRELGSYGRDESNRAISVTRPESPRMGDPDELNSIAIQLEGITGERFPYSTNQPRKIKIDWVLATFFSDLFWGAIAAPNCSLRNAHAAQNGSLVLRRGSKAHRPEVIANGCADRHFLGIVVLSHSEIGSNNPCSRDLSGVSDFLPLSRRKLGCGGMGVVWEGEDVKQMLGLPTPKSIHTGAVNLRAALSQSDPHAR